MIPGVNPSVEMRFFQIICRILSHAFFSYWFLPVKVSFPTLCTTLLGNEVTIEDSILIDSFINYVSRREAAILSAVSLSEQLVQKLSDIILCAYNCFQVPSCENLHGLVYKIAKCELIQKPLALLLTIHSGAWREQDVYKVYCCMTCTAEKVLGQIVSEPLSLLEQRTLRYFEQFVGNSNSRNLSTLLWFITGLPVCTEKNVRITFNALTGLSCRPVAHTCQ